MISRYSKLKVTLHSLIIICFIILETPLILLANKAEPFLFGFPFFLVWNLIWWLVLTVLFFIGYVTDWGAKSKENG